ncbi:MAG: hypothetical protein ACM3SY_20665 [Candidatus Omnitrophota bacterium]
MYSKHYFFNFLILACVFCLCLPVLPQKKPAPVSGIPRGMIIIDKIAALVNDEIITVTDIDKAIHFYSIEKKTTESEADFYHRVLERLIDDKVVNLEYKNDITLEEEDYNTVQTLVIEKLGSLEQLTALLDRYDMNWSDFKTFIREKAAYEKVVNVLLKVKVSITFNEIEDFYNKNYVPSQERLNLKPKSLIEMTPDIESHLQKEHIQKDLSGWLSEIRQSYKIENKLSNKELK